MTGSNALVSGGCEIGIIDTGRGQSNDPQAAGGRNNLPCKANLVWKHEVHTIDSLSDELLRRAVKDLEIRHHFRQWRRIKIARAHGSEIEKNCFHDFSVIL